MSERAMVRLDESASRLELEVFRDGPKSSDFAIAAAHPADSFGPETATLLAETGGRHAICTNPSGRGARAGAVTTSLDAMVERIEAMRRALGIGRWLFWGMSGGGWLAQIYARRHPDALAGIVIESVCLCFRERLADPKCVVSPFFAAWREPLRTAGLLDMDSHREASPGDDTEWIEVAGVGNVFRRRGGPALLVSPAPLDDAMRAVMPRLWEFDSRAWIGAVHVPALVLCGTADPVVPLRHVRAVHKAITGSTWVAIDGAGHVPTAERRPEVAAAFKRFASTLGGDRRARASDV